MHLPTLLIVAALIPLAACRQPATDDATEPAPVTDAAAAIRDIHSFAEPHRVAIRHLALDLAMDFAARTLAGTATLQLEWRDPAADALLLDTRDLTILRAEAGDPAGGWRELPFELAEPDRTLGRRLTLRTGGQPGSVRITYRTSPAASGLQWLTPAMTQGGRQPFIFSQSQQIHARSWVPLQDTPMVRFTYEARLRTPPELMALMSADNDPAAPRDGDYTFRMPQPIPSYLLAIAAGDLVFAPIDHRSGVWAEPALVQRAAAEFADTGRMIEAAETLYGPYRWDRYDILVLPPSFPYGGMENPRLTFATPTVIVGDRSLVALIAHELAHSWSGNLVTFATANDAWLNEGFTTYVEGRLIEALYGRERADLDRVIERNELRQEFAAENLALQPLAIAQEALPDPDDNLVGTVYTKGAWFLQFLEERFGRERFDAFLRGYFEHFAFQSISTVQFRDYACRHLLDLAPGRVSQAEFDAWLYQPGVPATAPQVTSARLAAVDAAREAWQANAALPQSAVTAAWSTQEWVHFLDGLPEAPDTERLAALDVAYQFTGTPNPEIAQRWYPLTVRGGYTAARPAMARFLNRVGRRKIVMPIYKALAATPDGLVFAREVFAAARPALHPITVASIEAALAVDQAPLAVPPAPPESAGSG
ncbi:MAG: M1 family metallopeptidase [Gammaproteobacteria bacterium]|nr:M1 family metallopeptidase [Gammaproteobacteria bacterium]